MSTPDFTHRIPLLFWAFFSLLLGVGFIFYGYIVFGYLVAALPWALNVCAIIFLLSFFSRKHGKKSYLKFAAGALSLCGALLLFNFTHWRDTVLWYIFVGYLIISAYSNMRPAWHPGLEKHSFARYAGGIAVWGFAILLLFMPRSGLSDALQLLGVFAAAWGVYQLLLPPCRE